MGVGPEVIFSQGTRWEESSDTCPRCGSALMRDKMAPGDKSIFCCFNCGYTHSIRRISNNEVLSDHTVST